MGVGDWISIAAIVVSSGFALWSALSARTSKKAETRASKQVDALVGIAAAMKIQADATKAKESDRKHLISVQEKAPWRVIKAGKMAWDIENVTPTPKFGVQFSGSAILRGRNHGIAKIDGLGTARIRGAFRSMQTTDDFTVTWHRNEDLSDEPVTWDGRLPST